MLRYSSLYTSSSLCEPSETTKKTCQNLKLSRKRLLNLKVRPEISLRKIMRRSFSTNSLRFNISGTIFKNWSKKVQKLTKPTIVSASLKAPIGAKTRKMFSNISARRESNLSLRIKICRICATAPKLQITKAEDPVSKVGIPLQIGSKTHLKTTFQWCPLTRKLIKIPLRISKETMLINLAEMLKICNKWLWNTLDINIVRAYPEMSGLSRTNNSSIQIAKAEIAMGACRP